MFRLATIQVHDTPIDTYHALVDTVQELCGQVLHNVVISDEGCVLSVHYKFARYLTKDTLYDTPVLLEAAEYTILMETPLEV